MRSLHPGVPRHYDAGANDEPAQPRAQRKRQESGNQENESEGEMLAREMSCDAFQTRSE
jgi:hypothetical protein